MLTVALIAKNWKRPKCLPTDEMINKLWNFHTMGQYSAIKEGIIDTHMDEYLTMPSVRRAHDVLSYLLKVLENAT